MNIILRLFCSAFSILSFTCWNCQSRIENPIHLLKGISVAWFLKDSETPLWIPYIKVYLTWVLSSDNCFSCSSQFDTSILEALDTTDLLQASSSCSAILLSIQSVKVVLFGVVSNRLSKAAKTSVAQWSSTVGIVKVKAHLAGAQISIINLRCLLENCLVLTLTNIVFASCWLTKYLYCPNLLRRYDCSLISSLLFSSLLFVFLFLPSSFFSLTFTAVFYTVMALTYPPFSLSLSYFLTLLFSSLFKTSSLHDIFILFSNKIWLYLKKKKTFIFCTRSYRV